MSPPDSRLVGGTRKTLGAFCKLLGRHTGAEWLQAGRSASVDVVAVLRCAVAHSGASHVPLSSFVFESFVLARRVQADEDEGDHLPEWIWMS